MNDTDGRKWKTQNTSKTFYKRGQKIRLKSLLPEAGGDVFEVVGVCLAVEALVGGGFLQGAEVADEGTYLDIVEVGLVDGGRNADATAVPRHLELRVLLVDILCQEVDTLGVGIAAHEGEAGDIVTILRHECVDGIRVEWQSDVFPEILTVAARTVAGAVADVDGQGDLVGYLLEDDICIDVLEHGRTP